MKRKPAAKRPTPTQPAPLAGSRPSRQSWLICLAVLAGLTLAMFGGVLFSAKPIVVSNANTDMANQFVDWRAFGFNELKHGNLALWNPHLFAGAPYFGGFQPALLYPLNALFLLLPLNQAINWTIALHVLLAGAFTLAWGARRGLRPPAALLSAVMFMFGGAYFLHVYAGHLSNLCAMIWAPLLFLALDGLAQQASLRWTLLGMFAVAMQVLAGHPQYVFYTGVAAGLYTALNFWMADDRKRFALASAGIVFGGVALSAVQLFTGFQESHETVRSLGVPYEFAGMFSFPPENVLTLFSPNFFSDMKALPYWGRCYLWEMSLFLSVTGLMLGVAGIAWAERRTRILFLAMIAALSLLALGSRTPLFRLLYEWVPGFNQFRGNSKFLFLAALFFSILAGIGFNELLKGRRPPRALAAIVSIAGLLLLLIALLVRQSSAAPFNDSAWHTFMSNMRTSEESYLSPNAYDDPAFALKAGTTAAQSLLIGGGTLIAMALLLFLARKDQRATWGLLGLATLELFVFARQSLDTFDPAEKDPVAVKQYLAAHPGDYRVLNLTGANTALRSGAQEIWGYDPGVTLRYAQLIALTQNLPPDKASQYMPFTRDHPLLGMLRCRVIFQPGQPPVYERPDFLPHVSLVPRCRVIETRGEIFSAMTSPAFNPREEVILETQPNPAPSPGPEPGTAAIVDSSTDQLTIEADTKSPAILLIADAYAKGWQVEALAGSSQSNYQLLPANYCLRAIPLAAGKHRLRIEYRPSGFVIGRCVSLGALLIFAGLVVTEARRGCLSK